MCARHDTALALSTGTRPPSCNSRQAKEPWPLTRKSQATVEGAMFLAHSVQASKCTRSTSNGIGASHAPEVGRLQVDAHKEVGERSDTAYARGVETKGMGRTTTSTAEEERGYAHGTDRDTSILYEGCGQGATVIGATKGSRNLNAKHGAPMTYGREVYTNGVGAKHG